MKNDNPKTSVLKPTMSLRYLQQTIGSKILQQLWIDENGNEYWKNIPIVYKCHKCTNVGLTDSNKGL